MSTKKLSVLIPRSKRAMRLKVAAQNCPTEWKSCYKSCVVVLQWPWQRQLVKVRRLG